MIKGLCVTFTITISKFTCTSMWGDTLKRTENRDSKLFQKDI